MITAICYNPTKKFWIEPNVDTISELLKEPQSLVWIDADKPTPEELKLISDELNWHPLVTEDLFQSQARAKVEQYDGMYSLVAFTAKILQQSAEDEETPIENIAFQRLNLMFGSRYLITIHEGACPEVNAVLARWQKQSQEPQPDIGMAVYTLLDTVVDDYFPVIDNIADRVDEIEDAIFGGAGSKSLLGLFQLKKDMLNFRRQVTPMRDAVNILLRRDQPVFHEHSYVYYRDLYDHLTRIADSIDTYRDLLAGALDMYLSVNSNRLNITMQTLTSWSIILMVGALITGFYGMNFDVMPELRWGLGHGWAFILILISTLGLIIYFKRKKWL